MPDSKITALTALTAADPANDMIPIVDVSDTPPASGNTKRISINNILACSPSATLASATIIGNLTVDTNTLFVDSANNRVGIGTASPTSDLDIFRPTGSGITSGISLRTAAGAGGDGSFIKWLSGGSNEKVAQIDGVLNGTDVGYLSFQCGNGADAMAEQYRIASSGLFTWYDGLGGTRMTLNSTGLGVGVSPAYNIDVLGATLPTIAVRATSAGASNARFYLECAGTNSGNVTYNRSLQALQLGANGPTSAQVTLDSSGNLGVGVTPSAWGSNNKVVQVGQLGSVYGRANLGYYGTKFNLYDDNTNNIAISTNFVGEYRFEVLNGSHVWLNKSTAGSIGVAQTLTQAMTLDASGRLLVGNSASGTAAGDGVVKLGAYGHCISQTGTSIASGSSVDLTIVTSGAGYQGFLAVANTQDASANTRTQTTYSVFGRGTASTITQIATANGSIGGASFTVTTPSNGVIRITNTSGLAATISAQFFGGVSA